MGVGLALDRPLELRDRASWRRWAPTWRLLAIAMPLTIAAVALLGWAAGLAPAAALLLGAVLAPTDPVLASDVQVAGPQTGDHEVDETDELRFTLTSEAGLNDGLAFPFVYAAILLATEGAVSALGAGVGRLLPRRQGGRSASLAGIVVGRVLAYVAFRSSSRSLRVAERGESLLALAALIASYGVGEVVGGYGFLSVFVCAMTFRSAERSHDYHAAMHEVAERLERLLTLFVLLVLGIALTRGLLDALDWRGVAHRAGPDPRGPARCRDPRARAPGASPDEHRRAHPPAAVGGGVLRRPRHRVDLLPRLRRRRGRRCWPRTGCGRRSRSRSSPRCWCTGSCRRRS